MDNKDIITQELRNHKDELVIDMGFNVVRLIGFMETDEDYYYIMEKIGGEIFYSSCVGKFYLLKGYIRDEDYNDINRVFELNKGGEWI